MASVEFDNGEVFPKGPVTVNVGCDEIVTVDKMYGPLVACAVRVRLDYNRGWIVERERIKRAADDYGDETSWEEVCAFDCQESLDFHDDGQG